MQWYSGKLATHGMQVDGITTMFLYLLGQATLGLITGKMQPPSVVSRWMFFGLLDGVCTHYWYHISEVLVVMLMPGFSEMARIGLKLLMTTLFYTPGYCLLFIIVSALWDGKGLKGCKEKLKVEARPLIIGTVPTWTVLNIFLFIWVKRRYRVLVAELFHYVYLIGASPTHLTKMSQK